MSLHFTASPGSTGRDPAHALLSSVPLECAAFQYMEGSARALPSVFLGLAALRSVSVWIMPSVCAVPRIFSLCSSQGFSQRQEGQCCFSPLPCAINTLSIARGVCVVTKMASWCRKCCNSWVLSRGLQWHSTSWALKQQFSVCSSH